MFIFYVLPRTEFCNNVDMHFSQKYMSVNAFTQKCAGLALLILNIIIILKLYSLTNFLRFLISGDITQKGYEKKRSRIVAPYVPKQALGKILIITFCRFLSFR